MTEPEQDRSQGEAGGRIFKRIFGTFFAGFALVAVILGFGCLLAKLLGRSDADVSVEFCLALFALGLVFVGAGVHMILFPDKWHADAHGGGGGG